MAWKLSVTGPMSNVEVSIAEMPAGWFWSSTIIGGTDEDTAAIDRGDMTSERRQELQRFALDARDKLLWTEVPGASDWMPPRRRAN